MVARSGGSKPVSAPSGVARLAVVAISQATGWGSWSATRPARKVLPAPGLPGDQHPAGEAQAVQGTVKLVLPCDQEVALLTTSSDQWGTSGPISTSA